MTKMEGITVGAGQEQLVDSKLCELQEEVVVSQNGGPQYRPQSTIILIIGIAKKVPLILGNPNPYNPL